MAKPFKHVNGTSLKYVHPIVCSGIYLIYKKVNENEILIEIKANNERDVLSVENVNCDVKMLLDLEVSCSSLD